MTLADEINKMIRTVLDSSTWTSAGGKNPVDNFIKEFRGIENPNLEEEIKEQLEISSTGQIKEEKQENINSAVLAFEVGNVGKLEKLSSQQFGNLQGFARDPVNFVFGTITKKLGKFARFGVFAFFAILIEQMIKFALNELMQPGRPWDRRFKRVIQEEVLLFTDRKEKEELRRGFREVRVTTRQGLRGGAGKVNGNLFSPFSIPSNFNRPDVVSTETNEQAAGLPKSGPTKRVF